jgi:hypothetical protein
MIQSTTDLKKLFFLQQDGGYPVFYMNNVDSFTRYKLLILPE